VRFYFDGGILVRWLEKRGRPKAIGTSEWIEREGKTRIIAAVLCRSSRWRGSTMWPMNPCRSPVSPVR
jgi:hypothetical protein